MKIRPLMFVVGFCMASLGAGAAEENAFLGMAERYEAIRQVLMDDSTAEVSRNAGEIAAIARDLQGDFSAHEAGVAEVDGEAVKDLLPGIIDGADSVARAKDLVLVRAALAELTKSLARYHALVKGPRPVVAYCPMEKKAWLQPDETVGNPYAPYMLRCGEVVQK